jgi:hypothetical protein
LKTAIPENRRNLGTTGILVVVAEEPPLIISTGFGPYVNKK